MPFGLCNAPSTFQRIMMTLTKGLNITPYIDDIIVPSKNADDNLCILREIFSRLRSMNFIPNYAEKAKWLSDLQNIPAKDFNTKWSQNSEFLQEELSSVKKENSNVTNVHLPDFSKEFSIFVNASENSIGGVLVQGKYPVIFYSRKLSSCKRNTLLIVSF